MSFLKRIRTWIIPTGVLLAALLVLGCSNPFSIDGESEDAASRNAASDEITIYYHSSSQPTIWLWETNGRAISELEGYGWPGVQMAEAGNDWWSYTIPSGYYPLDTEMNFIFNGASDRVDTSLDAPIQASAWYDGTWEIGDSEQNPEPEPGSSIKIYYQSSTRPTIWYWEQGNRAFSELEGHSWPGPQMADAGDGWWSYTIPEKFYPLPADIEFIFDGSGNKNETTLPGPVETSVRYDGL